MEIGEVMLTETKERPTESVEQDQIARMCSLILLYTLRKNKRLVTDDRIRVK